MIAHKLGVLTRHCDSEGTDSVRIEKSIIGGPDARDGTDAFLREIEEYAAPGTTKVWNSPAVPDPAGWVREATSRLSSRLGEILPGRLDGHENGPGE